MESIRILEKYSAPILIGLSLALMGWAVTTAGGFGPMLSTPSQFGVGMPKVRRGGAAPWADGGGRWQAVVGTTGERRRTGVVSRVGHGRVSLPACFDARYQVPGAFNTPHQRTSPRAVLCGDRTCCVWRLHVQEGQFWSVFWPAVTANVGYWATLSLNIPDFTRYAKSQKDQVSTRARVGRCQTPGYFHHGVFKFCALACSNWTPELQPFLQPFLHPPTHPPNN